MSVENTKKKSRNTVLSTIKKSASNIDKTNDTNSDLQRAEDAVPMGSGRISVQGPHQAAHPRKTSVTSPGKQSMMNTITENAPQDFFLGECQKSSTYKAESQHADRLEMLSRFSGGVSNVQRDIAKMSHQIQKEKEDSLLNAIRDKMKKPARVKRAGKLGKFANPTQSFMMRTGQTASGVTRTTTRPATAIQKGVSPGRVINRK